MSFNARNKKHSAFLVLLILLGSLFSVNFALAQSCPALTTVEGTVVTFVGELTDMGGDLTTSVWFEYGKTTSYGQKTSERTLTQEGVYCLTASGLDTGTTYHYRAVAQNSAGTSFGEDKTFTTTHSPANRSPIANAGSDKEVFENSSITIFGSGSDPDGDSLNYHWSCNGGTFSNQNIVQPIFFAPSVSQNTTYVCTLTVTDSHGASDSDSMRVLVKVLHSPDLSASLTANPSSSCAPLDNVDLTAAVSGTAVGSITYSFDCTNDGTWERIRTSSNSSYTASNLCDYTSSGTYTAKARVEREGLVAERTTQINVNSCASSPGLDLEINGSDGPITISYNTSATLSWTSSNVDSCTASGAWSGSKPTSDSSRSTGNLTSSKTYTLTCSGPGGTASDNVRVNVETASTFTVNKLVRNLSDGTNWLSSVAADPGEVLIFSIKVKAGNSPLYDVVVKDTLPSGIIYQGDLKIDNILTSGDILSGLDIGDLSANQEKRITFRADVAGAENFSFGETRLTNTVLVSSGVISRSDTTKVIVSRAAVAGAATAVSTGLTNNIFFDSFFLPLLITLLIIWLFKSRIIKFEEWLDLRKKGYQIYKSKKILQIKIAKIKAKEFFQKII